MSENIRTKKENKVKDVKWSKEHLDLLRASNWETKDIAFKKIADETGRSLNAIYQRFSLERSKKL